MLVLEVEGAGKSWEEVWLVGRGLSLFLIPLWKAGRVRQAHGGCSRRVSEG